VAIAELSIGQRSFLEQPDGGGSRPSPVFPVCSKSGFFLDFIAPVLGLLDGLCLHRRGSEHQDRAVTFAKEVPMPSSTNVWMGFAGLIYLVAGVFILRKEISAARGWDELITLGCVFIAVPLAVFAPEYFRGPRFIQNMVPSWMPGHLFWPYFVGCALLAAATSLTVRKFVRLLSTLLRLMFFLFCLHDLYTECARASQKSIRVGLRAN
jgi:hypothetical protein